MKNLHLITTDYQRPQIIGQHRGLSEMVSDAWSALAGRPPDHDSVYRQSGRPVRIISGGSSRPPAIDSIPVADMRLRISHAADWVRITSDRGPLRIVPPDTVAAAMACSSPPRKIPELDAIASAPIFSRAGQICAQRGYNADTRCWIDGRLRVPEVPAEPSASQTAEALALVREAVCDFRFVSESDLAHWIALALTPFVRLLIGGQIPMYCVVAPRHGSGKSLAANIAYQIWTGQPATPVTLPPGAEERQKWLTAIVRSAQSHIFLDNLSDRSELDVPELAAALTSGRWQGRLLGQSSMVDLTCSAIWVATGNNPRISAELCRRTAWIRLRDEGTRKPTDFTHPDVLGWVKGERGRLVAALLTLVRAWLASGRKPATASLAGFEDWSSVIGGILEHCGVPGFLCDREEIESERNSDDDLEPFCSSWWERYGDHIVNSSELVRLAQEDDLLGGQLGEGSERSQATRMGLLLKRVAGMRIGGWRVERSRDGLRKTGSFRLVTVDPT